MERFVYLDQTQFGSPIDSRPATVDVEFAVDALGMRADCTQCNHKLLGDFRARQFSFEEAEQFEFTLAERLHKSGKWGMGSGE